MGIYRGLLLYPFLNDWIEARIYYWIFAGKYSIFIDIDFKLV